MLSIHIKTMRITIVLILIVLCIIVRARLLDDIIYPGSKFFMEHQISKVWKANTGGLFVFNVANIEYFIAPNEKHNAIQIMFNRRNTTPTELINQTLESECNETTTIVTRLKKFKKGDTLSIYWSDIDMYTKENNNLPVHIKDQTFTQSKCIIDFFTKHTEDD
jgi:hypothetical protein